VITVKVKLFAVAREKAGRGEVSLQLPAGATVMAAREALGEVLPGVRGVLGRCGFAVNQAYVTGDARLTEGDELAVIPPVSGG